MYNLTKLVAVREHTERSLVGFRVALQGGAPLRRERQTTSRPDVKRRRPLNPQVHRLVDTIRSGYGTSPQPEKPFGTQDNDPWEMEIERLHGIHPTPNHRTHKQPGRGHGRPIGNRYQQPRPRDETGSLKRLCSMAAHHPLYLGNEARRCNQGFLPRRKL